MAKNDTATDAELPVIETTSDAASTPEAGADAPAATAAELPPLRFTAPPHTTSATIGGVPYEVVDGILEVPHGAVTPETIGAIVAHGFVAA